MKIQASPPRGTRDLLPEQVARRDSILASLINAYSKFGYQRIETPAIEDISRLQNGQGGENEKLIFQILRRGLPSHIEAEATISELVDLGLRYDLTVPLARYYANNRSDLPVPFRSIQAGPVWRAERPQRGRYRQFYQCDIDMVGEAGVLAEAELIEATSFALATVGLSDVTIRLSDRRLLTALATEAGIAEQDRNGFFVALDKLDKIGWDGVRAQFGELGFPARAADSVLGIVDLLGNASGDKLVDTLANTLPQLEAEVLSDFAVTAASLDRLAQSRSSRWRFDPTLVRGMGYYTGQIFEMSYPGVSGSVAGGGRYDKLLGRYLDHDVPACGFSIGFERIIDLAQYSADSAGLAVLFDSDVPIADILSTARSLRGDGSKVEVVKRSGKLAAQLERLERKGLTEFVHLRYDAHAKSVVCESITRSRSAAAT
jgi:histidyl-tRNA synthetase